MKFFNLFESLTKEMNYTEICNYSERDFIYFMVSNENLNIRANGSVLQFGFKSTFNKWSDSIDYEIKMPESKEELEEALNYLNSLKRCKRKTNRSNRSYQCYTWMDIKESKRNNGICDSCKDHRVKNSTKKKKGHTRRNS